MNASEASRFFIASGCPIATTTLYRCVHLQEQLRLLGYKAEVAEWFEETQIDVEKALTSDVIFLYRLAMSAPLERLITAAQDLGKKVIFDTDDLIFEPELTSWHRAVRKLSPKNQQQHLDGVRGYLETLLRSDAATVATPVLAELAQARGQVAFVHRNTLGREMLTLAQDFWEQRRNRPSREKIVIGYGSGTPTHDDDFEEAAGGLLHVLRQFPEVELWIAGPLTLPNSFAELQERIRRFPLTDWRGWFQLMSQMDLALAPLEMDNIFCRAKSEIKFVEAGALGVPVVASDIDPYRVCIASGQNGFLAAQAAEWENALSALVEQPKLRAEMGEAAHQTVQQRYTTEARAQDFAKLLPRLIE